MELKTVDEIYSGLVAEYGNEQRVIDGKGRRVLFVDIFNYTDSVVIQFAPMWRLQEITATVDRIGGYYIDARPEVFGNSIWSTIKPWAIQEVRKKRIGNLLKDL
ncbi:hypothetical protein GCM10027189_25000 [Rufibacter soli]